jgi:predicted Rossmann-fold nucleotide-binding protein
LSSGPTELHVVRTMHERKQLMAERAGAFVALPGASALEELYEVWSQQLGYHDKPVALLNVAATTTTLCFRLRHRRGFVSDAQHEALIVDDDAARLLRRIELAALRATAPDDYSQI